MSAWPPELLRQSVVGSRRRGGAGSWILLSAQVRETTPVAGTHFLLAPFVDTVLGGGHICPLPLPPGVITGQTGEAQGTGARSAQAQPGLPHLVAVSVAVTKWWSGGDRILGLPPGRRGGEAAAALPASALALSGKRLGLEGGWCGLQLCPQAGQGLVSRQYEVPEPSHFPHSWRGGGVDI